MKILQKYLLNEFLKYFAVTIISLIFFYVTIDFLSNIGAFTKHSPEFQYIIIYYIYKLPEIIYRILPLSILLSTLLSISVFNKNNEITAVKSSGLSMLKFFAPLIVLGLFLSVASFLLSNFVAVRTNVLRRVVMQRYINKNKSFNAKSVYKYTTKNILIHYKRSIVTAKIMNPSSKTIKGVNVYVFNDKFVLLKRYIAKSGRFGKKGLILVAGQIDSFNMKNKSGGFEQKYFKALIIPVYLNLNFFRSNTLRPEFLSIINLSKMVAVAKKSESGLSYVLTSYYSKLSFPLINLILILIGISIGLMLGKKGNSPVSIGISIVFAFTWWVINSISLSLGESAQLSPFLAAFMADIIFMSFAIYLIAGID
ncbi:MAG: YjgP/YjgQ family permease [Candidatus Acidulodesulfobacterium acidiphilum]|uniref:YjgP/YjgQ family permease n=1 Tax=Candidatus Acidulodesulfobacterium acidiphilum TaxID=2597224 RepID=A0A520X807_9DELT|nr:MAG: YjgP/YjgQ family permease [Candidatus Acidulodesulfobacterium acidiphilum]